MPLSFWKDVWILMIVDLAATNANRNLDRMSGITGTPQPRGVIEFFSRPVAFGKRCLPAKE